MLLTRLLAAATPLRATHVTVTTATCAAPGEVAHSLWMEVWEITTVQQPRHGLSEASCQMSFRVGRAMGSSGVAPRHDPDNFAPHSYRLRWFPRRRIAPVSHQPRNVIRGGWAAVRRHRRLPWRCEQGGRSLCRARRREDAGGLRAEGPAGCLSLPSAGSHCLNGLPVHGSIAVAGRRGQSDGGEPAVHIRNKTEWPTFAAASRSRRGGRHLIPSRVLIKGHTGTLRARAGYCPEVATPACRSHVRAAFRPTRPIPACRQAARPTPLRGMPPRRLRQHCRDTPGCVRPLADGLWSSVRCTT